VPSLATVSAFIANKKKLVRAMSWAMKPNRKDGGWYEFKSAVADAKTGVIFENVYVSAQWRPALGHRPAVFNLNLLLDTERVYAIDIQPLDMHKNNVGVGRPYYKKHISGIHEHTWSNDGYGYAEPISSIDTNNQRGFWELFLNKANIEPNGNFVHPDSAIDAGQGKLPL
jgi:hypothetical protein